MVINIYHTAITGTNTRKLYVLPTHPREICMLGKGVTVPQQNFMHLTQVCLGRD